MFIHALSIAAFALITTAAAIPTGASGCAASEVKPRCSCVPGSQTAPQAAAASALVVTGVVQRIERPIGLQGSRLVRVTVHADARWKGASADSVFVIVTGLGGGDCGYAFELDREYVIFAASTDVKDEYYTDICHRTRDVKSAATDVAALGKPPKRFRWHR